MDYTLSDLYTWSEKIEKMAVDCGLEFYPQEFEIVNYDDMLAYEVYLGMPSRYPHWSFGKAYEKLKTLYRYNLTGLPYEMVINSDPCIAYLLKENSLLLQILTIAHVYGHNDFFKNNRLFKIGTDAKYTIESFKNHARTIRSYINDPSIGYENVEMVLNAAHSLKLQIARTVGERKLTQEEIKQKLLDTYNDQHSNYNTLEPPKEIDPPDLTKIPLEPYEDIIYFLMEYGDLTEWQQNLLSIVREETKYFIPQIETKIMNEGWASYWHYRILQKLDLPQSLHLEFIKRHNDVVAPQRGGLNPYYLGFEIYHDLVERYGEDKIFEVRLLDRDESFIRRYLTEDLCAKLNLFEYKKKGSDYVVEEISDELGWEKIRSDLSNNVGMGLIPLIRVTDLNKKDKCLFLEHVYDGRELQCKYAEETLKYIASLWGARVELKTIMDNKKTIISCDEQNKVSIITYAQ
ncbi:SpoVR family protein [Bacillota bacterium LX-D]|nr:SpoVR family protein [Bacillota bacterium LX-D]